MKKIAMVTGAGTGIGKASALALMGAGYTVVLVGRRLERLEEVATEGQGKGWSSLVCSTDLTDPQSVAKTFAKVKKEFGRLDFLFNNAGAGTPPATPDEMSPAVWKACLDANLTTAFLCTHEAFKIMKEQNPRGGRIVNNGSVSAWAPRPGSCAYTAAKHGVTGLTKATSLDGRAFDIVCGQIDIGNAATEMTEKFMTGATQANGTIMPEPTIDVKIVADAILSMALLPLDANVQFMTLMASKMPLIGRG